MIRTGNEKLDPNTLVLPVAAGAAITEATMVALGTDGYAVPASKAANLTVAGVALEPADNRNGEAGYIRVKVRRGAFVMENSATSGSQAKATDILRTCYLEDAVTISMASTGSSPAGTVLAVEADGVTVWFNQPAMPAAE